MARASLSKAAKRRYVYDKTRDKYAIGCSVLCDKRCISPLKILTSLASVAIIRGIFHHNELRSLRMSVDVSILGTFFRALGSMSTWR